ncbi:MAG: hypothetical protein HYU52_17035 [Acidobacteria bacterium]|nr:hypothetical protein [Acidobacteriota bacterium]
MHAIIETALAFPTVIFTVLLGFVLLYAALVIVGAFDLEFLDSFLGLEALDDVDAITEGGDATASGDGAGVVAGIMAALGISGVPITIWGSAVVLLSWMLSMIGMELAAPLLPAGPVGTIFAAGIGLGSFLVGGFIASRLVRPLRKIYVTEKAPQRSSLVGHSCTILSTKVDATFGRGEIDDGGAGFIAEVRCDRPDALTRGDRAIVFDYDPEHGVFRVAPTASELLDADR